MGANLKSTKSSTVNSAGKLSFKVSFPSRIPAIFNIIWISGVLLIHNLFCF